METTSPTTIPPRELHGRLDSPEAPFLVDVRSGGEYKSGHLPGALHRPIDNLSVDTMKELAEKAGDRTVCFICQRAVRSKKALDIWKEAGVSGDAVELENGQQAWQEANLPLKKEEGGTISIERQVRIAAGSLGLIGTLLGAFVHPAFLIIPGFIGAGLAFAGITDTCGMAMLLAKMPWNR